MDEQAEVHTVHCCESKSVCSPCACTVEQKSPSIKTTLFCSVKCCVIKSLMILWSQRVVNKGLFQFHVYFYDDASNHFNFNFLKLKLMS